MNADFQNPLQVPQPKVQSHLTITVQSKLRSKSSPSLHSSKPPVAPKPRPVFLPHSHEESCHQQRLSNGELSHSDGETGDLLEMAEENLNKEEKKEEQGGVSDNSTGGNDKEDTAGGEPVVETEKEAEIFAGDGDVDSLDSEDTVKEDDLTEFTKDGNTENGLIEPEDGNHSDEEDTSMASQSPSEPEYETGQESEQILLEKTEGCCVLERENSDSGLNETNTEQSEDCLLRDLLTNEAELEAGRFAFGFSVLPTVAEEYPYDVIGPTDDASDTCESCDPAEAGDTEVWQPERATKDISGCFRFTSSTEDVFGPYSVIGAVPGSGSDTADPEWGPGDDDEDESSDKGNTQDASNQEPYYVSSDDVNKLEDKQADFEQHHNEDATEKSDQHEEKAKDTESADEYADIDDTVCLKADNTEQNECVSSEDYVEIGDEDEEEVEIEKKHIRGKSASERTAKREQAFRGQRKSASERTAKREQAFRGQRKSCQPRLRLCNITVPADLDLGRTPELTNRVVFAHTTEAFEEDIEELDCHIVPYYEDTDSDSEHIYVEVGFDSEGENFVTLDRKTIVTRSRSYSGKISGYVPETVPEESGTEYQTHDYCTVDEDKNSESLSHSQKPGVNSVTPSMNSRRFLLNSRSAEGPESLTSPSENIQALKNEIRMRKKDDTLSLPCVITSSGSFSQRSHQSSSGVSTPTSLVEIPPPFELAPITKRTVTKSSPALLIQHEPTEIPKKKKSSFKRFLALKFKKKTDSKGFSDGSVRSSRSSSESSHHGTRVIELDRISTCSSSQLQSRMVNNQKHPSELPTSFILYNKRKGDPKADGRSVSRVESFEERSRRSVMPLPLTKPRSISFPSADTSDYENIPAMSSDYENIQIPRRPTRSHTVTEFFENPTRTTVTCNDNDGYVDMNSFPGIDSKPQTSTSKADNESAYTEPFPMNTISAGLSGDEDHGRTSEEEDGVVEQGYDRQIDGRSRAFYIAKELVDSERLYVSALKHIQEDFRSAVTEAEEDDEGEPVLDKQRLEEILGVLPQVYSLHSSILAELEERISHWEENQKMVDVILSRREDFQVFDTYISEYDRSMYLLEESCRNNAAFSSIVKKFEAKGPEEPGVPMKHQLLQVIVRVLQYRMLLTDYLNNLSPDSKEYEDTQAALVIVSEVADQANDNLKQGENLLRLVHIEYSIKGKRDLLKPGRIFVKEGTLMKVSRKTRQPRHLFLMNDIMLYTYPQQDGKYRLKNTLSLSGMKVSKPVLDNVLNCLRIEVSDITITLSASSIGEREDWFHTLSRAIADHAAGLCTFGGPCSEAREKLWMALGEAAPVLVPVSQVMMCMNCTTDFSLTLRRHHCNACGKVVCRACSRNRFPLKYLKDRVAKVCDHCYTELRKRGGSVSGACGNSSPRIHRASRPLSAVFQSLQPPSLWKSRKSTSNLSQVSLGVEGSTMSGSLQRRKKSKRKWKRLWFLLKDKEKVASESLPLQGFTVKLTERPEGEESSNVFHLYHKKTLYYTFRAEDPLAARRWVNAMEEATVL
uniref:FYVE, RhoGEF and PH domain containing 5 n=1 Tax=Iconisemion striatum TaxID=60296 RepID=A0A1A7XKW7_9TELE